ncbi:MAG: hypothetical protein JO328_21565 [Hyphomicrobiales bacterium]|nr:hypothetical protein [Hyphomicrobiales bacterium]
MIKVTGALMVIAVSFGITLFYLQRSGHVVNDCKSDDLLALKPPFGSYGGKAFVAAFQVPDGDSTQQPKRSTIVLCEDEKRLGPGHTSHDEIRAKGLGRYSHWGFDVVFSSSDNSDPNTNHRRYSYLPIPHQQ